MNLLTYAGCIHQFQINENGYIQINIFEYDKNMEKFINAIEKPLIPSMTMKFNKCNIVGSCLIDKGLLVLLHLISSNNTILMLIHLQSRPWLCNIYYTLSILTSIYGSIKFLSINSFISLFINEDKNQNGFYLINNNKQIYQRNIEFIQCSLLTYIYCYLKDNYFWLMGNEIDLNTKRKLIKVYYGCSNSLSTPLDSFNTTKFIPLTLIDNIQDIYIINHKIQLKTRLILGDIIISSRDKRIITCHNGRIFHEILMNNLIISILSYHTIENEELFLFIKKDLDTIDIYQYEEDYKLISYINNTNHIANYILIDDFNQIGWKQILFLKDNINFNSFILTDFFQIHHFQQEYDYEYNIEDKFLSNDIDDTDIQTSLNLVQNILRKKIINADFIINEGHIQCKQIENNIQKINNKYHIEDLNISIQSENFIQLIDTNWFIYRKNLFLYVTLKNISNINLTSIYLFGIDKNCQKIKFFDLKISSESFLNKQIIFNLNSNSILTFILTTLIELDKDIDIDIYLLINYNNNNKLIRITSFIISIDDLIYQNNEKVLKINALEIESINNLMYQQAFIYLNTLFCLSIKIESTAKFNFIEHFQELLLNIGFKYLINIPNVYLRVNKGNIFEHILVRLVNEDDLIVHCYAENSNEATMFIKYILSKLDFQSFSLVDSFSRQQENDEVLNRIQNELTSYVDILKQIPTIMRKITPTSKSESYRLLKLENFQSFENERHITDLLLTSLIID